MEFDITTLIQEIKTRKPLWKKDNYNHSCRDVINKLWIEVADRMGVSKELVKTKWKGLRDNFRSELRKIPKKRNHLHTSKWIYFNDMMFLKDQMITKSSSNFISGDAEDVNVDVDVYTMDSNFGNENNVQHKNKFEYRTVDVFPNTLTTYPYGEVCPSKLLHPSNTYGMIPYSVSMVPSDNASLSNKEDNSTLNWQCNEVSGENSCNDMWNQSTVKKRKLNSTNSSHVNNHNVNTNDDEDYSFLMSLLPTVRTLPPDKKMFLRLKLQELVYSEVYNYSIRNNNSFLISSHSDSKIALPQTSTSKIC
ncbi:uncharacterized protein LOC142326751 [Lycorma delicatula]|uniref:uncharacterized protein LOC142326751 n=1 Tax=Lycorma delicatula TaxID=130591 RepID=UPI003F510EB7